MLALASSGTDLGLLEAGASVTPVGPGGWNALRLALRYGGPGDVQQVLSRQGPDGSSTDGGWTVLHLAARYQPELVASLADALPAGELSRVIDLPNEAGYRPLHLAILSRSEEAIRALLARGARPELPTQDGKTCAALAEAQGDGAWWRSLTTAAP
jgi:ankyrin repeat protein